jgi:hypothetical protein
VQADGLGLPSVPYDAEPPITSKSGFLPGKRNSSKTTMPSETKLTSRLGDCGRETHVPIVVSFCKSGPRDTFSSLSRRRHGMEMLYLCIAIILFEGESSRGSKKKQHQMRGYSRRESEWEAVRTYQSPTRWPTHMRSFVELAYRTWALTMYVQGIEGQALKGTVSVWTSHSIMSPFVASQARWHPTMALQTRSLDDFDGPIDDKIKIIGLIGPLALARGHNFHYSNVISTFSTSVSEHWWGKSRIVRITYTPPWSERIRWQGNWTRRSTLFNFFSKTTMLPLNQVLTFMH